MEGAEMLLFVVLCAFLPGSSTGLHQYQPNWASLDSRPLPSWYDQGKVGIFIHWGLFSVPSYGGGRSAGEWFWENWVGRRDPWIVEFMERNYLESFTYPDFQPEFKAELFDPEEWVDLFERAGAKYVVLTSKHHEGWANWPSKAAWNWNSMDSGPHRDLVGELANATRSMSSMRFGLYFSLFEWFHPLFLSDQANHFRTQRYVSEVAMPQLYDLVTNYQPHLIWSDGDWDGNSTYWNSTHFLAWLYNESPVRGEVVVNDRWGSDCSCAHGGYFTCHKWKKDMLLHLHKWEVDYSVMEGSWGYCRDYSIRKYCNISSIISEMVTTVSRGGNFLLNVGPTSDGRVPPIMEERLLQLGSWLEVNGEAIYNSTHWIHQNDSLHPSTIWYTYSAVSKSAYAVLLEWPADYMVVLGSACPEDGSPVILMGHGEVEWSVDSEGHVVISLPYLPLDSRLQHAWTLKFLPSKTC